VISTANRDTPLELGARAIVGIMNINTSVDMLPKPDIGETVSVEHSRAACANNLQKLRDRLVSRSL
jgi:hypothetical protein